MRISRFAQVVALVLALPSAGLAQVVAPAANEPQMGSEASPGIAMPVPVEPLSGTLPSTFGGEDGLYRILIVGDALAGGMGAGMSRMIADDGRFEIVNRFNEVSGLARAEVYDWVAAVPKIMATRPYDAAVIELGANDRQNIRTATGQLAFRTAEWTAAYEARIVQLLEVIKQQGAKAYWVSLPPMADPAFDADMQFLSGLFRKQAEARGAHFIDTRPSFLGPDGKFADRGPDETGADRKLRTRDGVAFLKQGNTRWGQLVVEAIKAAEAKAASGAPANTPAPVASAAETPVDAQNPGETEAAQPSVPMFGQQGLDGTSLAFNADSVPSPAEARKSGAVAAPAVVPSKPVISAAAGTEANRLFTEGRMAEGPAGRFDDFSYKAPVAPP